METTLQAHDDRDFKDLEIACKEYFFTGNAVALKSIVLTLNNQRGLWSRLFPDPLQRKAMEIALDQMETGYQAKKEVFRLCTAIQEARIRQQGDAFLAQHGVDLQSDLAVSVTRQIDLLCQTIDDYRDKFLARMKPQFENLEKYRDIRPLYERAMQNLEHQSESVFTSFNKLLAGFNDALTSKISGNVG